MDSATYLGDGLFARYDGFQIELYASNGIEKTNQVFLNDQVLERFERYVETLKVKRREAL